MQCDAIPLVSVVVPVRNGAPFVRTCIEALLLQKYPKDRLEIIVVDNGSLDSTRELLTEYDVVVLSENEISSYSARNKGVAYAKGEIIAFTDIDCTPSASWIVEGVQCLTRSSCEVVGGDISFTFSIRPTASELLDSLINLHNESYVSRSGSLKTANVFVYRRIFEATGPFLQKTISGGDSEWTARLKNKGVPIGYCPSAIVEHPARRFCALVAKHFRVGRGSIAVWRGQERSILWMIARWGSLFLPILSFQIPALVRRHGLPEIQYPVCKMMVVAYMCKIASGLGIVYSFFR